MSTHVRIQNSKTGQVKVVSRRTWDLLATGKNNGNERKGYVLIEEVNRAAQTQTPAERAQSSTMIPPAIAAAAEAARLAEQQAEAVAMSGAKVEAQAPQPDPQPEPVLDAPEGKSTPAEAPTPEALAEQATEQAAPEVQAPAEAEAAADLPTELADLDPSLTAKVAQVLAKGGIATKAQLKAAPLPKINTLLDQAGMGAKKAQAPGWKSKAAGK